MLEKEFQEVVANSDNPYELVVRTAREAQRINARRLGPTDKKPTTAAIEMIVRGESLSVVDGGENEPETDTAAGHDPSAA